MQIVSLTKDISSTPSFVKTLEHGRCREAANFDLFHQTVPHSFGVNDEFVPNSMLDLEHMPLFLVKHFVVTFDPNCLECNAPKEVPNFNFFAVFLGILFPNNVHFQLKLSQLPVLTLQSSCIINVAHLQALLA